MKKENVNIDKDNKKNYVTRNDADTSSEDINKRTEDNEEEDNEEDDDDGYTILPSNDSGITADDNAATGRMHEKEGD